MYDFEYTSHNIPIKFLFQNVYKFFLHARNLHQQYLPHLSDCKNLLFQVAMFHWIFTNHPYISRNKPIFATITRTYYCHDQKVCMYEKIVPFNFSSNLC